jgi:hypothetical protein
MSLASPDERITSSSNHFSYQPFEDPSAPESTLTITETSSMTRTTTASSFPNQDPTPISSNADTSTKRKSQRIGRITGATFGITGVLIVIVFSTLYAYHRRRKHHSFSSLHPFQSGTEILDAESAGMAASEQKLTPQSNDIPPLTVVDPDSATRAIRIDPMATRRLSELPHVPSPAHAATPEAEHIGRSSLETDPLSRPVSMASVYSTITDNTQAQPISDPSGPTEALVAPPLHHPPYGLDVRK